MTTRTQTFSSYNLDRDQMEELANGVLELIEQAAFRDGLIQKSDALTEKYSIILASKGIFSKWFDKIIFKESSPDTSRFVIVLNPPATKEEEK